MDALWPGEFDTTADRLILSALVILAIIVASQVLTAVATRRIEQANLRYSARKAVAWATYVFTAVALIIIYQPSLGGFGVALGVAGAGIAFALQEVIASVAGWFAISFAGFYKPGDRVQLGGIKGDVIGVGVLRTTLMEIGEWISADLYNGRVVRVANSFVFKEPVFNYSGDFPFLWDEVMFPVSYDSDWAYARETLARIGQEVVAGYQEEAAASWAGALRRYRLKQVEVEPAVSIFPREGWIAFRLRYIVDYRERRTTQDAIATRMLEASDQSQGRIRFATPTMQLVDGFEDLANH